MAINILPLPIRHFQQHGFPSRLYQKAPFLLLLGQHCPRNAFILICRGDSEQKFYRQGLAPEWHGWEIRLTEEITELMKKLKEASVLLHFKVTADRIDMLAEQLFRELLLQSKQPASVAPYELRIRQAASLLTRHYIAAVRKWKENLKKKPNFSLFFFCEQLNALKRGLACGILLRK